MYNRQQQITTTTTAATTTERKKLLKCYHTVKWGNETKQTFINYATNKNQHKNSN